MLCDLKQSDESDFNNDVLLWESIKNDNDWAASWQNLLMPYANNKDAYQPVHLRSLISAFVVRCIDSSGR